MVTPDIAVQGSFPLPPDTGPTSTQHTAEIHRVQINEQNKLVAAAAWLNYLILYLLVQ